MIKKFYNEFEQVILFFSTIIYLTVFMIVFDEEMRNTGWMGLLWIIQFFGLGTFIGLRGLKKGWKWPKRY